MWQRLVMLWWLAGAILIGLALPVAAIGIAIDHRRHQHWLSTGLAVAWCLIAVGVVGAVQGNMSPPLFGVPLLLLYSLAWSRGTLPFAIGVAGYFGITALVLFSASRQPGGIHWWYLLSWPALLAILLVWRAGRCPRI